MVKYLRVVRFQLRAADGHVVVPVSVGSDPEEEHGVAPAHQLRAESALQQHVLAFQDVHRLRRGRLLPSCHPCEERDHGLLAFFWLPGYDVSLTLGLN